MAGVGVALGAEQEKGGERAFACAPDLAADLRHIAPLADNFAAQFGGLVHRRNKGDLCGAQRWQIGEAACCRGVGDQRRSAAIERTTLLPFVERSEAHLAPGGGDRIEQFLDSHGSAT